MASAVASIFLAQDSVHDTKAVLGWNKHMMILAFRGTISMKNALSDIKVAALDALHSIRPPEAWQPSSAMSMAVNANCCVDVHHEAMFTRLLH